jgi:uncharacterized Rmd1/YagE family protein
VTPSKYLNLKARLSHHMSSPDIATPITYRWHLAKLGFFSTVLWCSGQYPILTQSTQLIVFETMVLDNIAATAHIPATLAEKGKIPLRRKELAKIRDRLFAAKSDIILHYGLLATPEFFWEYPNLESTYMQLARYLDIKPRVDLRSQKLSTIHELLEILADEQNHSHSAFLEWIVILLIGFEVVMAAFH